MYPTPMAYMIDSHLDHEIDTAFLASSQDHEVEKEPMKKLFKQHKKLMIKFLNRKWDISSLESHISNEIIPRGLRERIIPAEHLHTPRFLSIWKDECLNRGLSLMKLIVTEEEAQLSDLREELENSAKLLEPYKLDPDFEKNYEFIKKEIERIQKNLKHTKQEKFRKNLADWESGEIFNPTIPTRNRSLSRNSRQRQRQHSNRNSSSSESELDKDTSQKSVSFLEELEGAISLQDPKRPVDKQGNEGGKGNLEGRGKERDNTQNRRSGRLRSQRQC